MQRLVGLSLVGLIIDVVPNHTGENMDGRHLLLNFNVLDLPYYFRTDEELRHIGPFGNEVKSEERPMVQRWIVEVSDSTAHTSP